MNHPTKTRLAALAVLLTVAAAWLWAHEGHQALPTQGVAIDTHKGTVLLSESSRKALDVQTAPARLGSLDERLVVPATVVAPWNRHAFATSRLGGKIAALHVQPGQQVTAGHLLAEVQSLELQGLDLDLRQAANDAQLSADTLEKLEKAARDGAVSGQVVQEATARNQENRNAVEIARRKLISLGIEAAEVERLVRDRSSGPLKNLPIFSPIAGSVIHADVRVGQVIEPVDHLLEIVDTSTVWIQMDALEKDLPRVRVGQAVTLTFSRLPAIESVVQVVGLALDPKTHLGNVWAEYRNPPGADEPRLLPGMFGQCELRFPRGKKSLVVPEAALVRQGAESYVFLEEGPGQYSKKNVIVTRQVNGFAEIEQKELVPNDRVLTTGSHELATYFTQETLRLSKEAERTIGLRTETVGRHPVRDVLSLPALIELPAEARAIASARLPGTVQRIAIDRAQAVRAGDVIAEIYSLELQNLQLELLRNQLQMELLEQTLVQLKPLAEKGNTALSFRQYRETQSAVSAARQRRDSLRNKLESVGLAPEQINDVLARRQFISTLPLRAPLTGVVVRFNATLGQAIKAEDPLFEIHDLTHPLVRALVSESQMPLVRNGQRGRVRLASETSPVDVTVVRTGQVFDAADRSLSAWAELNADFPGKPRLLHGMLAQLTLLGEDKASVLAVPLSALWQEGARTFVFLKRPDASFERRPVKVGRADDERMEILDGLQAGEIVATSGVASLQTAYAAVR